MRIVLGVAGGIAAYKVAALLRLLTEAGHDVRVVPTRAALEFVLDRLGHPPFVAAGDSSLDHCLMEGAELALAPRGSELADKAPEGVTITRGEHLAAAEEILEAALAS